MGKNTVLHLHNGIILNCKTKKKKEILPFVTAWMDLEITMLRARQIPYALTYMWNLLNRQNRNRGIGTWNGLTVVRGEMEEAA